jgi:hypothetical protein
MRGIPMLPNQTPNSSVATSCAPNRPVKSKSQTLVDHYRPTFGCDRPTWGLRELKGNSVVTAESIKPTDIGTWAIFEVVRQRS